jgi:hypothetical protein
MITSVIRVSFEWNLKPAGRSGFGWLTDDVRAEIVVAADQTSINIPTLTAFLNLDALLGELF